MYIIVQLLDVKTKKDIAELAHSVEQSPCKR